MALLLESRVSRTCNLEDLSVMEHALTRERCTKAIEHRDEYSHKVAFTRASDVHLLPSVRLCGRPRAAHTAAHPQAFSR